MADDKQQSIPDLAALVDSIDEDPIDGARAGGAGGGRDIAALIEDDIGGQAHPTVARQALTSGMLRSLEAMPRPRPAPAAEALDAEAVESEPAKPRELEVPDEEKQTGLFLPIERDERDEALLTSEQSAFEVAHGAGARELSAAAFSDREAHVEAASAALEAPAQGEAQTNMYLPAVKAQKFLEAEKAKRPWIARHGLKLALLVVALGALGGGGYALYGALSAQPVDVVSGDAAHASSTDASAAARTSRGADGGVVGRFLADASAVAAGEGQILRFEKRGGRIVVPVTLQRGEKRVAVKMLFDTGATLTTLTPATLARLGASAARGAPTVSLRTAAGTVAAPLSLLDSVAVGKVRAAGGIAIGVCERCGGDGISGLLGLNVTRHFTVTIDHEKGSVELQPKRRALGHLFDVRPFVSLRNATSGRQGEQLTINVEVKSRAPRTIHQLLLVAKHSRDGQEVEVARGVVRQLLAGQTQRATLRGRVREQRLTFKLSIESAEW
ncbi:MAG: retropepsin-like domain-containing protein [Myxococcales bacterium]|nr:retropepsin-like domain-containing protein [Myxococcales bacterium]